MSLKDIYILVPETCDYVPIVKRDNYAPEGGILRRPPWNSAYHKHLLAYISWVHQAWLHALPTTDCLSRWITKNFTEKTIQTQYWPAYLQTPVHT